MPPADIEPLPRASLGQTLGLCEVLDDRGGREDVYRLARDLSYEFGEMLCVLKAAEMLELVETPGGDVVLTPAGKRAIDLDVAGKKRLVKEQLSKLQIVQHFLKLLENAGGSLDRETVLSELAIRLPQEDPERLFDTLLNWGRYADLFGYSRDTDRFFLQSEDPEAQAGGRAP